MNVALVIESLDGGGSERVVRRLAHGLAQRGQRVFAYCLRSGGLPSSEVLADGVTIREARSIGHDPLLAWRLARWLRRDRIDIAHAHSCAALVWIMPGAKLLGIPVVHVWHGWPLKHPTREHRLALRLNRFVDRVVVNSESLRRRMPACRPAREAVCIHNGIDLPPVPPQLARERLEMLCGSALQGPVVLSVGNIRVEKDICGLLSAVALLRNHWPRVQLVCVGGTSNRDYWHEVQRTVCALGLSANVHFPGPYSDAWRLMAGADVFCLGSRTESLPNVVLEAMSQRVPIVATAVGDIGDLHAPPQPGRWLLQHNLSGLLAPPGDPAALAAALDRTLRDPTIARQRAERALGDSQRFYAAEPMVQRYERVYEECRRQRPAPGKDRARPVTVLMLGPAPPQIGGMVTSIDLLMKSPLRERFSLRRCATPARPPGDDIASRGLFRHTWGLLESLTRHAAALVRLTTRIVGGRIDIVHIHTCSQFTFYRNLLDLAVAKLLCRVVVLHIRGGQFDRFCADSGPCHRWLIRRGCEAADAVVVLSEHWRCALQPYLGHARIRVIPNGVELATVEQRNGTNGHPCRFLYLALLTEAKGLADLFAAANLLLQEGAGFELLIAGPASAETRATWQRHTQVTGLAHVTQFMGPVTGAAKTQLFARADCFVHPSHSEGMPNAVLEAAAAGLPVIATAVGSVPEFMNAGEGAEPLAPLIAPHNPAALAGAMKRLAADVALRRKIGRDLQRRVAAEYSLPCVADRVGRLYDEILERKSS